MVCGGEGTAVPSMGGGGCRRCQVGVLNFCVKPFDVEPRTSYIHRCEPEVSICKNPPGSDSETHTLVWVFV